jgi:hypothetical protein
MLYASQAALRCTRLSITGRETERIEGDEEGEEMEFQRH